MGIDLVNLSQPIYESAVMNSSRRVPPEQLQMRLVVCSVLGEASCSAATTRMKQAKH